MNTYPDEAAFARPNTQAIDSQIGLTKREYFAAMAMQGICADSQCTDLKRIAHSAVAVADHLIKELNCEKK